MRSDTLERMDPDQELAQADAAVATTARALDVATMRARAARFETEQADRQAAVAYQAWAGASAHRTRLVARRLATPGPAPAAVSPPRAPWAGPVGEPARTETSAWSVQTVLLALGGVLLAVAAVVFTVVAWGAFGIGGRAVILAGITAVTFAVPALLHRRGLASTAETIGLLGLVLLALDGYALRHVGWVPSGLDGSRYAGIVLGAVVTVAVVYPFVVPLRALRPAGLVLAHPAVVLLFSPSPDAVAAYAALGLALAGADLLVRWYVRSAVLRGVAAVCGGMTGVLTALCAVIATGVASAPAQRVVGTLVLFGLAFAVVLAAETVRSGREVARGSAAGIAVPIALAGPVLQWLRFGPDGWGLTGVAVAIALSAAMTLALRNPWRTGTGVASAVLAVGAGLSPVTAVGLALLAPLVSPELIWGASSVAPPVWAVPGARPSPDLVGAVLALTVAAALLIVSLGGTIARQAAIGTAPLGGGAVVVLAPAAVGAPIWVTVLVVGVAALVATVAGSIRRTPDGAVPLWLGGVLAAHAIVVALASRDATLVTLGVVAALYGVVAVRSTGTRQVVGTGVALGTLGGWAAAGAAALTAGAPGWAGGPGPAGVAVGLTALVALGVTWSTRNTRPASATLAAIIAGVGAYLGAALVAVTPGAPGALRLVDRPLIAMLALGAGALAATAASLVSVARSGAFAAAVPGLAVAGLVLVPTVLAVVLGPLSWVTAVWSGAPADAARLGPAVTYPGTVLDPIVLLGAAVVVLAGWWRANRATALRFAAPLLAPGAASLPPALAAPWPVALTILLALSATATALACLPGITGRAATDPVVDPATDPATAHGSVGGSVAARRAVNTALAAVTTLTAVAWAFADRTATLVVLSSVVAAAATVTVASHETAPRRAGATTAAASAIALAFASGAAAGVPVAYVLVAVATALIVPGVFAAPRAVTDVLDAGAAAAGALALTLAAAAEAGLASAAAGRPDQPVLALTATLLGVPLGLAGLRAARRWCVRLVPAVELIALWAWLGRAGVTVPEAYTLPAAALAAAFGLYTLHRRPAVSSWLALGPALAVAAVPTLAVALSAGTLGPRVLLLGLAALAVTLAGVATRRQAPFLLGAAVLALVAGRALAPVLPALADTVPTWVPLSLAGALLLTVGATYERRRRDAARLAALIRGMH